MSLRTGLRFGVPERNPSWDSNARTHAQTDTPTTSVDHLTSVDARRGEAGFTTLGQAISDGILPTGARHEVIRTGQRDEIPMHVRSAVWHRDRGRCELCGWLRFDGPWHLDHITPWSAGGSDTTDNLRVLCERHNMDRGNQVDPTERPRMAATWWCLNCLSTPWPLATHPLTDETLPLCPKHRGSRWCPIRRALAWIAENDAEDWWTRDPIDPDTALTTAFCAHCFAPGLTDRPL